MVEIGSVIAEIYLLVFFLLMMMILLFLLLFYSRNLPFKVCVVVVVDVDVYVVVVDPRNLPLKFG